MFWPILGITLHFRHYITVIIDFFLNDLPQNMEIQYCTLYMYHILLHLLPLRFHCVEGCLDQTLDGCDFGIDSLTLHPHS